MIHDRASPPASSSSSGRCRLAGGLPPRKRTPSRRSRRPAFASSRARPPLGSPVDLTYRFVVAADAPAFDKDYRVHGALPRLRRRADVDRRPRPADADEAVEARADDRVHADHVRADVSVHRARPRSSIGLYRPGPDGGCRSPARTAASAPTRSGTLELLPQTENVFLIYKDGWHQAEVAADNATVEWQWTKKVATICVPEPEAGRHVLPARRQSRAGVQRSRRRSTLLLGDQSSTRSRSSPKEEVIRRIPLTAAQLGTAEKVELRLEVDQTSCRRCCRRQSRDPRELGIRVFHAFVERSPVRTAARPSTGQTRSPRSARSSLPLAVAARVPVSCRRRPRPSSSRLARGRTLSVEGHRIDGDRSCSRCAAGGEIVCDARARRIEIVPDEVPYPEPDGRGERSAALDAGRSARGPLRRP